MHYIFSVIFFISIGQYCCLPRTCTTEERCLPVDASVCDNSKCLLLKKSDVDLTVSRGLKSYAWNIGRSSFFSNCPLSVKYEMPDTYEESPPMIETFTLKSGKGCNETMTVKNNKVADPDPSTGQVRLLTTEYSGDKFEECYLYLDPGKALVYRKCLIQPNYPTGQACAYIVAATDASEKCLSDDFVDFVNELGVDLPKKTVDCM